MPWEPRLRAILVLLTFSAGCADMVRRLIHDERSEMAKCPGARAANCTCDGTCNVACMTGSSLVMAPKCACAECKDLACPRKVSPSCTCSGKCGGAVFCVCDSCFDQMLKNVPVFPPGGGSGSSSGITWTGSSASPPGGGGGGGGGGSGSSYGFTWSGMPILGSISATGGNATGSPASPVPPRPLRPRTGRAGIEGFDGTAVADFPLAAGSVRGLRQWDFPVGGDLRRRLNDAGAEPSVDALLAPGMSTPLLRGATGGLWRPGVNVAKCNNDASHQPPVEYDERGETCGCGYWAYWKLDPSRRWNEGVLIMGVVEGTGRVLIGEKGFRCQKARILALVPAFAIEPGYRATVGRDVYGNVYGRIPPGSDAGREMAEAKERAEAWMGVVMEALGTLYPDARIFATVKGMLASFPPGEVTS